MDRRRETRVRARIKIRFKDADAFISEYTHNISKGGLFVRTTQTCPLESMVEVILVLPDVDTEVSGIGRVMHVVKPDLATESHPVGMGLELVEMKPKDRETIEDFIDKRMADLGSAERRRSKRHIATLRVRFGDMNALREEYTHNISHGGIFIKTGKPKKLHEKIKIILVHPETNEKLSLNGEVVRTVDEEAGKRTGEPSGMGILFHDVNDETRAKIDAFIESVVTTIYG